jgi:hypothetical protein
LSFSQKTAAELPDEVREMPQPLLRLIATGYFFVHCCSGLQTSLSMLRNGFCGRPPQKALAVDLMILAGEE